MTTIASLTPSVYSKMYRNLYRISTQRRSIAKTAASICLFVRVFVWQHDNFPTSKRRMVKLGVGALYKNLGRVRIWGHSPLGVHPQKSGVELRRRENQRMLSSLKMHAPKSLIAKCDITAALNKRNSTVAEKTHDAAY